MVSRGFCSAFLTPPLFAADGFVAVSLSLGAGSLPCAATPLGFAAFREAIVVVVLLTHSVATLPGACFEPGCLMDWERRHGTRCFIGARPTSHAAFSQVLELLQE